MFGCAGLEFGLATLVLRYLLALGHSTMLWACGEEPQLAGRGKERAEGTGSGGCDELADENRGCGWIWEPEGVVRRVRREGESSEGQKKSGQ